MALSKKITRKKMVWVTELRLPIIILQCDDVTLAAPRSSVRFYISSVSHEHILHLATSLL